MESYKLISALVVCFLRTAFAAVDENNGWAYPGQAEGPFDNLPWVIGSTKPLEWYTTLTDYNITLWQMDPPSLVGIIWQTSNGNGAGARKTLDWKVDTLDADTSVSSRYMLWGGYEINRTSSSGFTSYTFNVSDKAVASTTTSSTSSAIASSSTFASAESTGTAASSTTSASAESTGTAASSTNSATPEPEAKQNDTATLGLGIGLGVGISVAIALGILGWCMFRKRKQKSHELAANPLSHEKDGRPRPPVYESADGTPRWKGAVAYEPVELSAERGVSELRG